MNGVNKTLYIPLYGKAYVSRMGILLEDRKAEQIWEAEGFPLKGKARSKWLAYYIGMRSAVFDGWVKAQLEENPQTVVLHLGCGMDSRALRVGNTANAWYDVDFPQVMEERRRYFREEGGYRMLGADITGEDWLEEISGQSATVVMEGVSMYISPEKLRQLLGRLGERFTQVRLLVDCYTVAAAKASKVRNPINEVGVREVYGLDDPKVLEGSGFRFVKRHDMTPDTMIRQLPRAQQGIFRWLYAGKIADGMYRLYEYRLEP